MALIIFLQAAYDIYRGFGPHMSHTHSVIMWRNQDGTTTLSQRYASGYHEPKLENAPPRVATIVEPSALVVSSTVCYVVQVDFKQLYSC